MALEAGPGRPRRTGPPEVRVLTSEDVPLLRLGWHNRLDAHEAQRLVTSYPGRSVWIPDSREFALAGPWRHRDEVAAIQELSAIRRVDAMMQAVVSNCRDAGAAVVLMTELTERRRPALYERIGFQLLEEVITYELELPFDHPIAAAPLTFVPVHTSDEAGMAELLRLDQAAFPWLWWNSDLEFRAYASTPGVDLYLGLLDGRPVSYVGTTSYAGWGHLDRIAVDPAVQGSGWGKRSLAFAMSLLAARGARRIGLSTQRDNLRSQRLYEGVGFRRSRGNDYWLYGVVLRQPKQGNLDATT
ncbi:MAG: GNAT family N-acetyltransferase [Chloroflexota bacterium]|nr:GNAT family N-acetyltransferase [Chloroflexota bacterium]